MGLNISLGFFFSAVAVRPCYFGQNERVKGRGKPKEEGDFLDRKEEGR